MCMSVCVCVAACNALSKLYVVCSMEYVVCDTDFRYSKVVRGKQNTPVHGTVLVSCTDKEV